MPTIHINVKNRVATANGDSRIINGNSDYSIEFDFDAEWADLNNKIGIFAYNDAAAHKWAYQTVMFSGSTCTVPILRDIHCVYVGVTAGNVRVTTPAKVQCRLSISDYADTEEPPSADIWGQILAKLDELQTEIDEIKAGGGGDGAEVYYAELDGVYPSYTLSADTPLADIAKAYAANKSIVCRCDAGGMTATLPLFIPISETNTWIFSGSGSLGERYPAQTFTVAITPFGVEAELRRIAAQTALDAVTATANEAVLYTLQNLGKEQKQQAQKNIGINPEDRTTNMTNPVGVDGYGKLWSKADTSLNVTGATVGQTIKVKAVDANGKPTAWEAVDMAAGNTEVWELINQIEIPVGAEEATLFTIDKDLKGSSFELERAQFFVYMPKYTGESTVPSFSFICVNGYYGGKIAPMIYTDILSPSAGNARDFVYLAEKDPQTGLWHESVKYEKINGSLRVGTMGGAGSYRDLYDCAGELIGVLHPITSIGIRQTIVYAGCKYWLYGVRK